MQSRPSEEAEFSQVIMLNVKALLLKPIYVAAMSLHIGPLSLSLSQIKDDLTALFSSDNNLHNRLLSLSFIILLFYFYYFYFCLRQNLYKYNTYIVILLLKEGDFHNTQILLNEMHVWSCFDSRLKFELFIWSVI